MLLVISMISISGFGQQPFTITDDSYTTGADTAHLKVLKNTATGEWVSDMKIQILGQIHAGFEDVII